jgi:ferredoxin-NADP reductase
MAGLARALGVTADEQGDEAIVELVVHQVTLEADAVVSLTLSRADRGELAPWDPGSHIDVVLPSGLVRQYSLCGDLGDRRSYRIAVLRERESRGGSREIHESALVGRSLAVRGPRNRFRLVEAERYVFVAGGIGVTPILPMLQLVEAEGRPWSLTYGGRERSHMAFLDELARHGASIEIVPENECGLPDLERIVARADGAAIYACGPPAMLAALEQCCANEGRLHALHLERFTANGEAPSALGDTSAAFGTFEVELRRSGAVITVPADRSLLRCVREVVPTVLFSCEEGYCGTCETRVLDGTPDHRDSVLSDEERAANTTMMICVGRAHSARLVLDL